MSPSANEPTRLIDKVRPLLPRVGSPLAYSAAAIVVAVGVALRFPLDALTTEPLPPFITLYPAIVAAAFAGGTRAGVFAMLLSLLAAWLLWLAPAPDVPLVEIRQILADEGYSAGARSGWLKTLLTDITSQDPKLSDPNRAKLAAMVKEILDKNQKGKPIADDTL